MDNLFPVKAALPFTVHTYDIDAAGHVNNVVYIRWLEDLRNLIVEGTFGFKHLIETHHYLVVISTEAKYRKQISLFDRPEGEMTLTGVKHGIYELRAVITVNGRTSFSAVQKCVVINTKTGTMFTGKTDGFKLPSEMPY
ncbi:MAG: thioesterase family protein [Ignavibacteriaceae bacterium]|nr:thioesterase family protein [Ignavibacteriaceae bacterium]